MGVQGFGDGATEEKATDIKMRNYFWSQSPVPRSIDQPCWHCKQRTNIIRSHSISTPGSLKVSSLAIVKSREVETIRSGKEEKETDVLRGSKILYNTQFHVFGITSTVRLLLESPLHDDGSRPTVSSLV
jgi:hypothetical protein